MFRPILLVLLTTKRSIFASEICGVNPSPTIKVLRGNETDLNEFSWMALLEYQTDSGTDFLCSGALINNRYVLTAAQCINSSLISVRLGEYDTGNTTDYFEHFGHRRTADPPLDIPIEETIKHEDYRAEGPNQYNDIALLKLKEAVKFGEFVRHVCLPTPAIAVRPGEQLFVTGWHRTSGSESRVKLSVRASLKNNSDCEKTFRHYHHHFNLTSRHLCAGGERGRDACAGNVGDPLMKFHTDRRSKFSQWYAVGIASFRVSPCGLKGLNGGYTSIEDYVPWIRSKMRI